MDFPKVMHPHRPGDEFSPVTPICQPGPSGLCQSVCVLVSDKSGLMLDQGNQLRKP